MYSTSSIKTRATWTAFPYNIAWWDKTGHFDYCSQVDTSTGRSTGQEGTGGASRRPPTRTTLSASRPRGDP